MNKMDNVKITTIRDFPDNIVMLISGKVNLDKLNEELKSKKIGLIKIKKMSNIAKGGFRKDLGIYVRSKMEANICRYYKFTEIEYIYEPEEFEFKTIKRGNRYYKPDFYLPIIDLWVECKGWFRPEDKTKLRRFKKYYPEEFAKLKFIIPDKYSRSKTNGEMIKFLCDDLGMDFEEIISYKEMEKYGKLIPGWE